MTDAVDLPSDDVALEDRRRRRQQLLELRRDGALLRAALRPARRTRQRSQALLHNRTTRG